MMNNDTFEATETTDETEFGDAGAGGIDLKTARQLLVVDVPEIAEWLGATCGDAFDDEEQMKILFVLDNAEFSRRGAAALQRLAAR